MVVRTVAATKLMIITARSSTNTNVNTNLTTVKRNKPIVVISTNPAHIGLHSLSNLYKACNHSPHRFPSSSLEADLDLSKLSLAVRHSTVVVSVFAPKEYGEGDYEEGEWGLLKSLLPAWVWVSPENGKLVGFGRAVSDVAFVGTIHDVMVIPPLRRMGIGKSIVRQIMRMLINRGIYDIVAVCSQNESLFFEACGFGDDLEGTTPMMYTKTASGNLDDGDAEITTQAGQKLLIAPPLRLCLSSKKHHLSSLLNGVDDLSTRIQES